ncbi:MAG: DNA alkylation repair protein [Bacteroidetes bacterium]|nr:DNA alkylation repair protein [Bacteroidota bacterium]
MESILLLEKELRKHATAERARVSVRYFKTAKGEYGEGDQFLGVAVPIQRALAAKYVSQVTEAEISDLLSSPFHEIRLTALFMLNTRFLKSADQAEAKKWVDFYLSHIQYINNWDLVDSSAPIVLGTWLQNRNRRILYQFARSKNLWKNRIAILSTLAFIRKNELADLLKLAEIFIHHPHDLLHKATGWMLREGWKRDPQVIEAFLTKFASQMPRTMLRYSIEKMSPTKKKRFMK